MISHYTSQAITMVANSISPKLIQRHRMQPSSSSSSAKPISEDEFDQQITTLNPAMVASMSLSTGAELEKLKEIGAKTPILPSQIGTDFNFKRKIVWTNAIGFLLLHLCALIGIIQTVLFIPYIKTTMYCELLDTIKTIKLHF